MPCKITLIGAGSVVFAKTLISDILQFPELSDATICLMDLDPERLKVADTMMKRIAAKLNVKAKVISTMDRRTAIKDAKYVICTIKVGGFAPSTIADFEIPAKYGLKQTIADTLGIGGIFRGLRTIPAMLEIARDIEAVAHPDCLLLNYSNPMAMNCWAVNEAVGIPHIGLCHSVFGTARMLASHANLPFDDISYQVAGINHMAFFLNFKYRGQDAYPLLYKILENPTRNFEQVRYEMMRRTGYFVTESSEHQAEYTPHFIHHGDDTINQFDIPINEYLRRCEAIMSIWSDSEAELIGDNGEIKIDPQSHEYGAYIIHARETNTPRTVYGNVPNNGIIDNLTPACCVEVPILVDGNGLQPVQIGALPEQLAAICMTNVNVQRLTVDAALTMKREHIYHAAMLDPHTAATLPLDKIWELCDELIETHQKDGFLGEFASTVRNTGRSAAGFSDRIIVQSQGRKLKLDTVDSEFELEITAENPRDEATTLTLDLRPESDGIVFANDSLTLELPAKETVTVCALGTVKRALSERTFVDIRSEDPSVLTIGSMLIPRRKLATSEDGTADFNMEISGFPCATGKLSREGEHLRLQMDIADSNLKIRPRAPWEGSSVELFFAQEGRPGITQLFAIHGEEDEPKMLNVSNGIVRRVKTGKITSRATKVNYSFEALIPCEAAGISNEGPFLLDVYTNVNALGEAHSGGRSSLSGRFESNSDMGLALEIDL